MEAEGLAGTKALRYEQDCKLDNLKVIAAHCKCSGDWWKNIPGLRGRGIFVSPLSFQPAGPCPPSQLLFLFYFQSSLHFLTSSTLLLLPHLSKINFERKIPTLL
jgi:hypothetical protein